MPFLLTFNAIIIAKSTSSSEESVVSTHISRSKNQNDPRQVNYLRSAVDMTCADSDQKNRLNLNKVHVYAGITIYYETTLKQNAFMIREK
jgi:hypothetical protein